MFSHTLTTKNAPSALDEK